MNRCLATSRFQVGSLMALRRDLRPWDLYNSLYQHAEYIVHVLITQVSQLQRRTEDLEILPVSS